MQQTVLQPALNPFYLVMGLRYCGSVVLCRVVLATSGASGSTIPAVSTLITLYLHHTSQYSAQSPARRGETGWRGELPPSRRTGAVRWCGRLVVAGTVGAPASHP